MELKNIFRKVTGERIPDIIEYLKEYIQDNPTVTISIGCDSSRKKHGILYATTIMLHDHTVRDGAHVVFYRKKIKEKLDIFNRLYKEGEMILEVANYINDNLKNFHTRKDMSDENIKKYKLHLDQHKGNNVFIDGTDEEKLLKSIMVTNKDRLIEYKVCDIHLDYNIDYGKGRNKSHNVFKAVVPWFKSSGYRVWCKPYSPASSSMADNLVR